MDALAITVVLIATLLDGPLGFGGPRAGAPAAPDGRAVPGNPGGPSGSAENLLPLWGIVIPLTIVLAACALVLLRRRWPIPVLGASLALYFAAVLLREPSLGVGITAVLAAYRVGARTSRRTTIISGVAATVLVAALSFASSEFGVVDVRVFQIAAALAVASALGDSARSHREVVFAATERAERAEQAREAIAQQRVAEERLRIAQDLHDTVAHQISVISLSAGAASSALESNPERARRSLHAIRDSARSVLTEIGGLLEYLRADGAPELAPGPGTDDVATLISRMRDAGLNVSVTEFGEWRGARGTTAAALYRVVQEGLTNAHKHGAGGEAAVDISVDGAEIVVSIMNPVSPGPRRRTEATGAGLGLIGLSERVAALGGSIRTSTGAQFFIEARLPFNREESR